MLKREQFYNRFPPPGGPIPSHIKLPPVNDNWPLDHKVQRAVKKGGKGRTGGASKMRTEDLKIWLADVENKGKVLDKGEDCFEWGGGTPGGYS